MERDILERQFLNKFRAGVLSTYRKYKRRCLFKLGHSFKKYFKLIPAERRKSFDLSSEQCFVMTVLNELLRARELSRSVKKELGKRDHRTLQKRLSKCKTLEEFVTFFPPNERHVIKNKACEALGFDPCEIDTPTRIGCSVLSELAVGDRRADAIAIFRHAAKLWVAVLEYKTSSCIDVSRYRRLSERDLSEITKEFIRDRSFRCKETGLISAHVIQTKSTCENVVRSLAACRRYITSSVKRGAGKGLLFFEIKVDAFVWTACKRKQVRNVVFHVCGYALGRYPVCLLKRLYGRGISSILYDAIVESLIKSSQQCSRERDVSLRRARMYERRRILENRKTKAARTNRKSTKQTT